jgi:hypothetical protein
MIERISLRIIAATIKIPHVIASLLSVFTGNSLDSHDKLGLIPFVGFDARYRVFDLGIRCFRGVGEKRRCGAPHVVKEVTLPRNLESPDRFTRYS